MDDNCFLLARAASYSAVLALFPGLIFITALLFGNDARRAVDDLAISLGQVFPPSVSEMLANYLTVDPGRSGIVLVLAGLAASLFAADFVSSLMEGFRAAYRLKRRASLWREYGLALALVYLSILPLTAANAGLILSRQLSAGLAAVFGSGFALLDSRLVWWPLALSALTLVLALLYYAAPNRHQRWRDVLPGALLGAFLWAPATALFAFYVQSIVRYSEFYGSVSTVIVLLIWTYLSSVVVLVGCEFNAARERRLGTLAPRE